MSNAVHAAPNAREGFTLVELMVVLVIIAILSSLTLAGLARAGSRGKADSTKFMIRKLSDALMDQYESYEDLALSITSTASPHTTVPATRRARIREEMPDSWADVGPTLTGTTSNIGTPKTAVGLAYQRYRAAHPATSSNKTFQGAECLYMIITQSGWFPEFMASVNPSRVGDTDDDGAREFLDGWNRPIEFLRWAPGVPPLLTPIQTPDPTTAPDPLEEDHLPPLANRCFAMFPLIYSSGPDGATGEAGAYGLVVSENGWPDAQLDDICNFSPKGSGKVGEASSGSTTYRDNITNHMLIAE